ncbi:MAG: hypothetical protein EPO64_03895 [Nitrospirae bacterium]|nr:MAG: hypothetical protein EPO64_03895 [Nitrospirota bacterium]
MSSPQPTPDQSWQDIEQWWVEMARRLGVVERVQLFFKNALGHGGVLERVERTGGDVHYILFVLLRYWIPPVLPPSGRERTSKSDQDYWLESEQILKAAVARLRELKPLIELLTSSNPLAGEPPPESPQAKPVVEVELAQMLEGIAEVAGSYGGPDYTSVIKNFDPIPLRQTQPFKHNKKHSAELWVVFLLREHFKGLGMGKDRYWPLIADVVAAAGIHQLTGLPYQADELKSWWQKNWPRTYTRLEQKSGSAEPSAPAYQHDFDWFRSWFAWQTSRPPQPDR